jgi:aconitate hydratase
MSKLPNPFNTLKTFPFDNTRCYYSLTALEEQKLAKISRLPISIRIMLESLLRNFDGSVVAEEDVIRLANWNARRPGEEDVPFIVARVILQDFTGVPLLVDLAAMRDAVAAKGFKAEMIEPKVPVDLVIDHSVQVDKAGTEDAFTFNLKTEFGRNIERYSFLKWGQEAFKTFKVVPPGIGIVHQVNLEYIAKVVIGKQVEGKRILYPDTLVGTDSHTTMINGLGVVGWGVGGIEAEAAMLGQPVALQIPEVIGVLLEGHLQEGVTATDLTLRITELLRKEKVVGKFVEFFGKGTESLTVVDRATIANMAPEYGATMGFFPIDQMTLDYLKMTGRDEHDIHEIKEYFTLQKLFGVPKRGEVDYTKIIELDLGSVRPCVSGPKRPQDRLELPDVKGKFLSLLKTPVSEGGYGKKDNAHVHIQSDGTFSLKAPHQTGGIATLESGMLPWSESEMVTNKPITSAVTEPHPAGSFQGALQHGSIVIAAITSCTNTSNPVVMIGAGLLAKKAVETGLTINPMIKTSLAPGSRVVTDYLEKTGLQPYLNQLGFELVAYGCTTCIGNSGPLDQRIEGAVKQYDLITASVLSGNRNFEARIHGAVKANFLMSPPLVIAFAIAGRIDIDLDKEPLGYDKDKKPVFLKDIWPSSKEIEAAIQQGIDPSLFKKRYADVWEGTSIWKKIAITTSAQYAWDQKSTYIQKPPYFETFDLKLPKQIPLKDMRPLAFFGDSVTTDHISPAGAFGPDTPAGKYLISLGIKPEDFNSYGSRRGNHNVMMRGTFANVRIRNQMVQGKEGGFTKLMPEGTVMSIFEAGQIYAQKNVPLIIFAGKDYGMGSSRDWAAKGTALLGVRVVVAKSFERIHRSNLIGMGVLPLEFASEESWEALKLDGTESFSILGLEKGITPRQDVMLEIQRDEKAERVKLRLRIDTKTEVNYYLHGGIMPYVLRQILET